MARARVRNGTAAVSLDATLKAYRIIRAPTDRLNGTASFYYYLYNGVLDQTVEQAVLGDEAADASVGKLVESALSQHIAIRAFDNDNANVSEDLTPNGRSLALAAMQAGQRLIMPVRRPSGWPEGYMGWWGVAPDTGWTEDSTELGLHQAMTEYGETNKKVATRNVRAVCLLALKLASLMVLQTNILTEQGALQSEFAQVPETAEEMACGEAGEPPGFQPPPGPPPPPPPGVPPFSWPGPGP